MIPPAISIKRQLKLPHSRLRVNEPRPGAGSHSPAPPRSALALDGGQFDPSVQFMLCPARSLAAFARAEFWANSLKNRHAA
jgi:hypothetical protein